MQSSLLVTGGAGPVGARVIVLLVDAGHWRAVRDRQFRAQDFYPRGRNETIRP